MEVTRIIAEIDLQISKLQQAKELLSESEIKVAKRPGRPKGSKNSKAAVPPAKAPSQRKLSPEGRKRIAEAMKRRWAERKKQAVKAPAPAK